MDVDSVECRNCGGPLDSPRCGYCGSIPISFSVKEPVEKESKSPDIECSENISFELNGDVLVATIYQNNGPPVVDSIDLSSLA